MLVFQFHKIASFFCSNFSNNAHRAHHSVSALLNNRKINKISLIKRETLQYHLLICVEYRTDVFISMFVAFHFSFFSEKYTDAPLPENTISHWSCICYIYKVVKYYDIDI